MRKRAQECDMLRVTKRCPQRGQVHKGLFLRTLRRAAMKRLEYLKKQRRRSDLRLLINGSVIGSYAVGCDFCSRRVPQPDGLRATLAKYANTPAAIRSIPNANELMPHTCSLCLRTIEKVSNSIGGMPTAIAP